MTDVADDVASPRRPDTLTLLTSFGSPIALGTVLFLYFGWVRSEAQAREFGADASVFQMSTQDLVLRSVDVVFLPIVVLLLLSSLALRVDPWLRAHARILAPILRFAWVLVPLGLVLRAVAPGTGDVVFPLWVLLAIGGQAYGAVLRRHLAGERSAPRFGQVVLVVLLLIATLFWQTERVAVVAGQARADDIKANLPCRLPAATVLSVGALHLDAPTVEETQLDGGSDGFGYRYAGLHLLQRSGGAYFLLTDGWAAGDGRLVLVPDTDTVRLEFGGAPSACP